MQLMDNWHEVFWSSSYSDQSVFKVVTNLVWAPPLSIPPLPGSPSYPFFSSLSSPFIHKAENLLGVFQKSRIALSSFTAFLVT